jgi:hypothetical protein
MKLMHRIMLVPAIALALLPGMTIRASAQSALDQGLQSCNSISDPIRRGNCRLAIQARHAQMELARSWTPRQRYLVGRVSHLMYDYFVRWGQPLPVNQENVVTVMRLIGANQQEAGFVINRMQIEHNAVIVLNQANQTIMRTNQFLQCLERGATNCIP